ncbi:MAG: acylneuraminate cytidylyltransferase family protein [Firmicutes bacterium]|nr:acylneuraminate cytidylyltransferase family protein [Bacillota bacterium]
MYQEKRVLGIIPARAGSKGVPGKNVRLIAGKPLINYTINTALASGIFDYLLVSTDGKDIAQVAKEAGAKVPFLRPPELATDTAKGIDVLFHAIDWCRENKMEFDWIIYLQPTSPLRSDEDIYNACTLMLERRAKAIVSVCEMDHHPWWSNVLPEDGCMKSFMRPEVVNTNRQGLPKYYRLNGAIYIAELEFLRQHKSWFGNQTYAYIMPQERSVDIDNPIDFALAEQLLSTFG